MKQGLFHKRIPTIFALGILACIILVTTVLIRSGVFYIGKAAPEAIPQNISITNISDTTFAVIFTTPVSSTGVVSIKESKGGSISLDDRDKKVGVAGNYFSHHITVPNLEPEKTYTFSILVNGKKFANKSFRVKTGPKITSSPPEQNPIFGKVLLPTGENASDTLVTAKTADGQLISSITSSKGSFIIPTNSLRNSKLSDYLLLTNTSEFKINAFRENMKSEIISTFEIAQNLPPISLLEQYNFFNTFEGTASSSSQLSIPGEDVSQNVIIAIPKNGQSFTDFRPSFSGTAYPNHTVLITINDLPQTSVTSTSRGVWSYRPNSNLSQGEHTVIIESTDDTGQKITQASTFFIFPQGSQVSQSATPSATPTIIPTPTSTPTSTPTPAPTIVSATPTQTLPTPTPTPFSTTPTVVISTTISPNAYQTPTPTLPPTGKSINSIAMGGLSILLIVAGTILLFAL